MASSWRKLTPAQEDFYTRMFIRHVIEKSLLVPLECAWALYTIALEANGL